MSVQNRIGYLRLLGQDGRGDGEREEVTFMNVYSSKKYLEDLFGEVWW